MGRDPNVRHWLSSKCPDAVRVEEGRKVRPCGVTSIGGKYQGRRTAYGAGREGTKRVVHRVPQCLSAPQTCSADVVQQSQPKEPQSECGQQNLQPLLPMSDISREHAWNTGRPGYLGTQIYESHFTRSFSLLCVRTREEASVPLRLSSVVRWEEKGKERM